MQKFFSKGGWKVLHPPLAGGGENDPPLEYSPARCYFHNLWYKWIATYNMCGVLHS